MAEAGEPHANASKGGRGLQFSALELEQEAWLRLLGPGVPFDLGTGVLYDPHLAELLEDVCRQAFRGDHALRDALLERFLTTLRERVRRPLSDPGPPVDRRQHALSSACRDYVFAHTRERITLADLAARTGFNADYLARRFRRDYGMTAHQYLLSARLDLARKLLRSGRSPSRVAADVGFSDQAHLTRVFKRLYRTTPGKYRRSLGTPTSRAG